jgi:catechol 2,3-dioxygenase-like lactoylglutathione lyase family enzyme
VTRVNPYSVPAAFATLILAFLPIDAVELKIDHVTVAGAKLESMRQAFTAATGLATEYGGRHANHATEMALTSFPDGSYVELMGIQAQADPAAVAAHEWRKFLENNAGPCAFAIRSGSPAGVPVKSPQRSGRARPDGTRLEWETTDIGSGVRGTFFPFLIRDLTPRENRAFLKGQPTTRKALGVAKVVVGVRDLEAAIALYRRAFQLSAPRRQRDAEFGAELAWFEGTPVVLAQGLAKDSWLARRVSEFGDGPCAFVLRSAGGLAAANASRWFGSTVVWTNEQRLGWRLGFQSAP